VNVMDNNQWNESCEQKIVFHFLQIIFLDQEIEMQWQDDERQWHDTCDNYGEVVHPSEAEIAKMHLKQSPWYRTDGGIAYCKITNTFLKKQIYYRVTEDSMKRKQKQLKVRERARWQDKWEENMYFKHIIEEKLKEIDEELKKMDGVDSLENIPHSSEEAPILRTQT
jgi:hypothetical protein